MSNINKHKAKNIQSSIRKILLNDWDPIGICCDKNIEDEYDSYIAGVYHILSTNRDMDKLKTFLSNSEIQIMDQLVRCTMIN